MYKRIRILHRTAYYYHQPVTFGPHRAMLRPREGHDVHIVKGQYQIEPKAAVRWLRDVHGNSIAVITFSEPSDRLVIASEVDVEFRSDNPIECLIDPGARCFPFQYAPDEQLELMSYRLPSYPYDGPMLQEWLRELYRPGQTAETSNFSASSIPTSSSRSNMRIVTIRACSSRTTLSRLARDRAATSQC